MKIDLPDNITTNELEKIQESLKVTREKKKKWTVYVKKVKQEIAKYTAICAVSVAIRKL